MSEADGFVAIFYVLFFILYAIHWCIKKVLICCGIKSPVLHRIATAACFALIAVAISLAVAIVLLVALPSQLQTYTIPLVSPVQYAMALSQSSLSGGSKLTLPPQLSPEQIDNLSQNPIDVYYLSSMTEIRRMFGPYHIVDYGSVRLPALSANGGPQSFAVLVSASQRSIASILIKFDDFPKQFSNMVVRYLTDVQWAKWDQRTLPVPSEFLFEKPLVQTLDNNGTATLQDTFTFIAPFDGKVDYSVLYIVLWVKQGSFSGGTLSLQSQASYYEQAEEDLYCTLDQIQRECVSPSDAVAVVLSQRAPKGNGSDPTIHISAPMTVATGPVDPSSSIMPIEYRQTLSAWKLAVLIIGAILLVLLTLSISCCCVIQYSIKQDREKAQELLATGGIIGTVVFLLGVRRRAGSGSATASRSRSASERVASPAAATRSEPSPSLPPSETTASPTSTQPMVSPSANSSQQFSDFAAASQYPSGVAPSYGAPAPSSAPYPQQQWGQYPYPQQYPNVTYSQYQYPSADQPQRYSQSLSRQAVVAPSAPIQGESEIRDNLPPQSIDS